MNERAELWSDILDALPPGWRTTAPSFDPGRDRCEAVAVAPKLGGRRGPAPATFIGEGPTEIDALRELARRLVG